MDTPVFTIPPKSVPIIATPDLCVIGGGAAGIAAAVGAARCGVKVLLVEKYGFCGGATVAGASGTICGLFSSGERPQRIVFGFAGEFHDRLAQVGGAGRCIRFGKTALVPHDSFLWKSVADCYLRHEGIETLFHTNFVSAYCEEDRVSTIVVRAAEGLCAIKPKQVVDASGDAEVVHTIGGSTTMGKDGVVQTPTMIFRLGGVQMEAFLKVDPEELSRQVAAADRSGAYRLPRHHVYVFPMPNGREVLCNMTRITYPDGSVPVGTSSADLSFAEMEGRAQASEYARFLHDKIPGFQESYMVDTGAQVGIRQSRSLVSKRRLSNEDVLQARKTPGAATFSAWPIECHSAGDLNITYLENDTYDIPFETLIPLAGTNLLVAGRCLSAEHEAMASARVTAQCFGMGYAAGAASALMLQEHISSQRLNGVDVESWMHDHHLKTAGEA
ncbi:MAG TPA: FAD-dependent oxidoreductase [Candidatus Sulfotelmatobacter sp.]|nr:FAD-dependent oxidoreductase [Candidatus Sulfotelmatobacter sp.]